MSCDIRVYESCDSGDGEQMTLTAYAGGKNGNCIQFSIGGKFCGISQLALLDMIHTILYRVNCEEGYTATGFERPDIKYTPHRGAGGRR